MRRMTPNRPSPPVPAGDRTEFLVRTNPFPSEAVISGNIFPVHPVPGRELPANSILERWYAGCYVTATNVVNVMIEALFSHANYVATKKVMDATMLRHEAIASNLANVETPNYKRIDLKTSFTDELRRAIAGRDASALSGMQPALGRDPNATSPNLDGNTVQLEHELMELNQNFLSHSFQAQLITGRMKHLRMAITGK